jgi:hypothetical protein
MPLHPYRRTVVAPDTYQGLCSLEQSLKKLGKTLIYEGVSLKQASWEGVQEDPGPLGFLSPEVSMRPTGREVYLRRQDGDPSALWGAAVPLGFVPWDRYPVPSPTSHVFHYVGVWAQLGGYLQGEGLGDWVWPSLCCAAQIEVGTWAGPRLVERSIQTHLHRLGIHCGPINGEITPRVTNAIRALGLSQKTQVEVVGALEGMVLPKEEPKGKEAQGHLVFNGAPIQTYTSGGVYTSPTRQGVAIFVQSPGRLIVDFGGVDGKKP